MPNNSMHRILLLKKLINLKYLLGHITNVNRRTYRTIPFRVEQFGTNRQLAMKDNPRCNRIARSGK